MAKSLNAMITALRSLGWKFDPESDTCRNKLHGNKSFDIFDAFDLESANRPDELKTAILTNAIHQYLHAKP